jgi:hypothetical protein
LKDQQDKLEDDTKIWLSLPECYLYFIHHFIYIITRSVLLLEHDTIMNWEIHEIMCTLKSKLECRLKDKFFGKNVNSSLILSLFRK